MNGAYGEGLLAAQQAREMAWHMLVGAAWVFIGAVALVALVRLWRCR
jgi:hypothetical protein